MQVLLLLLIPAGVICLQRVSTKVLVKRSFHLHALTGVIGTPLHELSHFIACVVFGMRVLKVKLYSPNPHTGLLGYVQFAYKPNSLVHMFGLLVQGIAPVVMGYSIISFLLPTTSSEIDVPFTNASTPYELGINAAWSATLGAFVSGEWVGCGTGLLALVIGLHAVPSGSDLKLAFRGGVCVLLVLTTFGLISQIEVPASVPAAPIFSVVQAKIFAWVCTGLDIATEAVTMICCIASLSTLLLQILPSALVGMPGLIRMLSEPAGANNCGSVSISTTFEPGKSPQSPVTIDGETGRVDRG
ncbi:hypothetical protein OU5_P0414 (plasmid) [Pseudomonas mandelii JR-1]|uniref:Uncharacterized protein n=1 Tax=Pseudomonas mandelii JR-1 TaxID=1147786 RepID=A0A024EM58_9PSED|nr:hypothetical protein OU5_P0414 [Pseudomonas mandelii JR-1]